MERIEQLQAVVESMSDDYECLFLVNFDTDEEEHFRISEKIEMTSLCEGVETQQQSDFLKEIGCNIQQGYYFARPLPEEDFVNMLDA